VNDPRWLEVALACPSMSHATLRLYVLLWRELDLTTFRPLSKRTTGRRAGVFGRGYERAIPWLIAQRWIERGPDAHLLLDGPPRRTYRLLVPPSTMRQSVPERGKAA
jgi:hypothetical protein